ncbi:glycoside hydrolase superfamily [Gaertneriomyces semiglobifer]|nr:glycoside hydrolase superfamily [Gaertneriomyces semiglobifer]
MPRYAPRQSTKPVPAGGITIYEVPARPWLYDLNQKHGSIKSLDDVPQSELDYFVKHGVGMLWLQGVWSLGTWALDNVDRVEPNRIKSYNEHLPGWTQDDVIGSPYAIKEYNVNPELGGNEALQRFRQRLAGVGIKLMLDFVPNHVAVDAVVASDPSKQDLFIHRPNNAPPSDKWDASGRAHGADLYSGNWVDTLQLNHWSPVTRKHLQDELKKLATMADGLRVDMAMLLVNDVVEKAWGDVLRANGFQRPSTEFWEETIPLLEQVNPSFYLIAEVYDWTDFNPLLDVRLQRMGFDATYDKKLYDSLKKPHLDNLRGYIGNEAREGRLPKQVHFVENHDETRALRHFESQQLADVAAVTSLTLPGPRLTWWGQYEGQKAKLVVQLRRYRFDPTEDVVKIYDKLGPLIASRLFTEGTWTQLFPVAESSNTAWRMLAWKWVFNGERAVVIVNPTEQWADGRVTLSEVPDQTGSWTVEEVFSGEKYQRDAKEIRSRGLHVALKPWGYQIFRY